MCMWNGKSQTQIYYLIYTFTTDLDYHLVSNFLLTQAFLRFFSLRKRGMTRALVNLLQQEAASTRAVERGAISPCTTHPRTGM